MKLSVNLNKIALLRNARGENYPQIEYFANKAIDLGVDGLTLHPRPDHRHATSDDVINISKLTKARGVEFNIEGNPIKKFIDMVMKNKTDQVTLVPDAKSDLTSSAGWDTLKHKNYLKEIVSELNSNKIRTSIFLDPELKYIDPLNEIGTDRIEFYTESFAKNYKINKEKAIEPYKKCAKLINEMGIGINAGHDLSLDNILFFKNNIENLLEVSIGHALITESLDFGIETVIKKYLSYLK